MNMKKSLFAGIALLVAMHAIAIDTDTKKFFGGAPSSKDVTLPADKVYPTGRLFPFSFYSTGGGSERKRGELLPPDVYAADLKKIADGGVSLIGPQYALSNRIIEDAQGMKVHAVYTVYGKMNGEAITKKFFKGKDELDVEKMKNETAPFIREAAKNSEIAIWDLVPEERRHWNKRDVLYIKTMYELIKENDPLKRPVFMYEPGHLTADSLAKMLPYQDISAKGMYVNHYGYKEQRVWVRYSMEQEVEAIRKANVGHPVVPFALPSMFKDIPVEEYPMVSRWVDHDVYCAIANGARGILVFSARRRPNFAPALRELYLDAYLRIAKELSKGSELSQAILFGKPTTDLEVVVAEGPERIPLKKNKLDTTYPPLSVAQFAWENARYVLVVNSATVPVKGVVDNLVYGSRITVQNLISRKKEPVFTAPEGNFEFTLAPYEAACYKIFENKNGD